MDVPPNLRSRLSRPAADSRVRRARPVTALAAGAVLLSVTLAGCAGSTASVEPTTAVTTAVGVEQQAATGTTGGPGAAAPGA